MDSHHPRISPRLALADPCVREKWLWYLSPLLTGLHRGQLFQCVYPKHEIVSLPEQNFSLVGMALSYIILTSCYYSNVFNGRDLIWMSTSLFGTNGSTYDQDAVITSDYRLNETALETVGLPRYTTTYAIAQLSYNLSLGAAVTTMLLWHWPKLSKGKFVFFRHVSILISFVLFSIRQNADFKEWSCRCGRPSLSRWIFTTTAENMNLINLILAQRCWNTVSSTLFQQVFSFTNLIAEVPQWAYGALLLASLAVCIGTSYAAPTVLIPAWSIIFFTGEPLIIFHCWWWPTYHKSLRIHHVGHPGLQ